MIDGIFQNPNCYNLKDLTVGDLCEIPSWHRWIIDGDRKTMTYYGLTECFNGLISVFPSELEQLIGAKFYWNI